MSRKCSQSISRHCSLCPPILPDSQDPEARQSCEPLVEASCVSVCCPVATPASEMVVEHALQRAIWSSASLHPTLDVVMSVLSSFIHTVAMNSHTSKDCDGTRGRKLLRFYSSRSTSYVLRSTPSGIEWCLSLTSRTMALYERRAPRQRQLVLGMCRVRSAEKREERSLACLLRRQCRMPESDNRQSAEERMSINLQPH